MVTYDNSFNLNEWFILGVFAASIALTVLLPRWKLPLILIFTVYGISVGKFFDHTISVGPFRFYDVNDNSHYELMDFISYIMYGPFSYFFVYFYKKLNINGFQNIYYISVWSACSMGLEFLGTKIGIYHYVNHYRLLFSLPVYVLTQTSLVIFYHLIMKEFKRLTNS
ncbi:hypothetical protein [Neobacillus sp. LXY-1]|uniref:hypothetical protein n=1 Tax=Neobacillus sp. LXY-1 TaxID=3379133 RepID=UPI003EE0CC42